MCVSRHIYHMMCVLLGSIGKSRFAQFSALLLKLPLSRTVVVTTCADGTQQISSSGALLSLPLVLILCFTQQL